ncbi:uncharacterized protein LOC132066454 [Lycium ferocissimum]|uniref:uncharacterized protein LOC132066454 n=1 Tax=Lycium ferocissimum TaxID=112874 RepID=UPI002814CB10|nr:uncharacterized protein LOC132066454 [Lycium ferocissimum]
MAGERLRAYNNFHASVNAKLPTFLIGVGNQSHNFCWTMQSCDIPGPSSAPDSSELSGGSIVRYRPTQVESFTERCNDFEENPVLTQLTQIVSNNDVANDHSGMLFHNKKEMKGAVRQYCLKEKKEFICDQSKGKFWRVICKRHMLGCEWMIRFREISSGMWKAGKADLHHSCLTDDYRKDHFNLNSHLIATTLIPYIMVDPYKSVQEKIKGLHLFTPSYRKAQKGCKKAIEMVFGDFETSFKTLPRYMAALKYFNPGTVVEWEHESTTMQGEHIFKFFFWAYKPSIDGFKSCRPVISIDGTHLYGKYEMKLLIAVGIDANNNIFPLAYAIVARESFESWTWFLVLLWRHTVRERQGIGLISDRHQGILQCVQTHDWLQPPSTHHRFCVRHLKSNFNKKFLNGDLENLMWLAATSTEEEI